MGQWRQLRALIVEDDPVFALELTYAIRDAGHEVVAHESRVAEAVDAVKRLKPDIALVDLTLNEGEVGVDLARRLTRGARPLVVFVTAQPERLPPDLAGARGVLHKPVSSADIAATLHFLAAELSGREAPKPGPLQLPSE